MTQSFSIYFAGELFSLKHLVGNTLLADAIETQSKGRYRCFVPQDHEQRETTAVAIRNQDLLHAATSDLGLFHFDGPELDSGTVCEFMVAKMLDIPSVILRSDFRLAGDTKTVPWNLMLADYPRTEVVVLDSIALYQKGLHREGLSPKQAAATANEQLATMVIEALDKVRSTPPVLSPEQKRAAYENMRLFPGGHFDAILTKEKMEAALASKLERGL
jgi:nucleoside 2-deoxyribosyltransferase